MVFFVSFIIMKVFYRILCLVLLFVIPGVILANEKYSFEKAERLKPLIERRDYSPSVFVEASEQKKPIFLLLTAPSWCYRCQVYESEEYLFDPRIIEIINTKTVPVYVDADLRQDLTRKYLEWGWPSTTVMSPTWERIFGYSWPRPIENMIENINNARSFVQTSGTWAIQQELYVTAWLPELQEASLDRMMQNFESQATNGFDSQFGWFGTAKKFPQWRVLNHFVEKYKETKEQKRIDMVALTLEQQYTDLSELSTNYNLYDPVEGWFHRYGVARDRSPPHYEKMLYDNVRLLNAYHNYWTTWLDDPYVAEVVAGTWKYLLNDYYDAENWWFYANTDVNGEDAYYAKNPRPEPKARVEETKYTDRNADAVIALLEIRNRMVEDSVLQTPTGEVIISIEQIDLMIQDTLKYLQNRIVTKNGAYHYQQPDGTRGVRWSIVDHGLLLLAFVDAYEYYKDDSYLKTAKRIADFSLEDLYDRYGWWFFERNSPDRELYALWDFIDLTKPITENNALAYSLAKLGDITDNENYKAASYGTLAWLSIQWQWWWLDRGFYSYKAAEYFKNWNLASSDKPSIDALFEKKQKNSRLNGYIDGSAYSQDFQLSWVGLESYTHRGFGIFAILALLAGILSFLSPCTLPVLPAYVANVLRSDQWSTVKRIIWFMFGLISIFTVLWLSATWLGKFFHNRMEVVIPLVWIILIVVWLLLALWEGFDWFTKSLWKSKAETSSSILLGMSMWIAWTPCVWPILLSILAVAWLQSQMWQWAVLLIIYGLWLAIPLLLVWFLFEKRRMSEIWNWLKGKELDIWWTKIHSTTLISWVLIMWVGLLILFWWLDLIAMRWAKSFGSGWLWDIERSLIK